MHPNDCCKTCGRPHNSSWGDDHPFEPPAEPRSITHVALIFNGKVWSLPRPYRHHHIIRTIVALGEAEKVDSQSQGFLDDMGRYVSRQRAFEIVKRNGQLPTGIIIGGVLTSEDLW